MPQNIILKLEAQTISQIVDQLLELPENTKVIILAPVINNRKGSHTDLINELRAQGFIRVRLDGTIYEIDNLPEIEKKINHQNRCCDRSTKNKSRDKTTHYRIY